MTLRNIPTWIAVVLFLSRIQISFCQPGNFIQTHEKELSAAGGEQKAEIIFALITHYGGTDPKKAMTYSNQLIQLGRQLKDPAMEAQGLCEKGNLFRRISQRDSAELLLHRSRKLMITTENEKIEALIHLRLGLFFDNVNNDSARYYFRLAFSEYMNAKQMHWAALALTFQGSILQGLGRMDSSKVFFDKASSMIEGVLTSDSSYWPARNGATVANYQGTYHTLVGRYEESLRWNLQALRFFEMAGDARAQAVAHHSTGVTYRKLLKYERAIEQFRRAFPKFQSVNDQAGMEACYASLAVSFEDIHRLDSAEIYFNRALALAVELDNKNMQGTIFNNMGAMYYGDKKYKKAAQFYEKALEIRGGEKGARLRDRAAAMINLGQTALETGEITKAGTYLTKGLRFARELQSRDYEKSALEGIVDYFMARKDFRTALAYQDSLVVLKDSIYLAESRSKVAEMEIRYETGKKEQQILLLKEQNKFAHLKQTLWMGGFAIAVMISGLLVYTFQNRKARINAELTLTRKEKEVIRNELVYKDRELVNLATYITEKNNFLETMLETIDAIDTKSETAQRQLKKLPPLIRENINISGSREEFNAFMTTVYGGFIRKLEDKFPELTDYEKRLATLLRVNLSSKQIASVLNISSKSVDMSRYRLRKKMGLTADQDILQTLNTL